MYNHQEPENAPGAVISTNQTVNLTATLSSMCFVIGLFFCFADQRSRTIRRYSVQSVGLGAFWAGAIMSLWILAAIFGWIPVIGRTLSILCLIIGLICTILDLGLRVRLMLNAYRGLAYVLPGIGTLLRRFE
ncbi:MAG TPA: hypothetical protein PKE04_17675 [Clostridia bacterium]|nr:hypothetical protein [Clostridia bacterium]